MRATFARRRTNRGLVQLLLVAVLALAALAGGVYWLSSTNDEAADANLVLHDMQREDFELTITERGELEAAGVTEVRSEVKTENQPGLAILRVVDEGTQVKAGDFLVELDSSALEAEQTAQQNLVNLAEASVVETRNLYETALIAKQEYVEGTYLQERTTIEGEIFVAEENLNRAKEYYQFSKKLAAKGHINELQLEADKFAVEKSAKELEAAKTKLRVLDEFTKPKMVKQLDSDIVITEAKWGSAKKSFELELTTLKEIDDRIAKCTIYAPKDGLVIYANDLDRRGGEDWVVEEGAVVRERQVIFRLPDSEKMRVELKVNEALVQYVKPGLPAIIRPIGVDDTELTGTVTSVNRYAEPGNWRKADVKEYKAFVSIDQAMAGLRSGMTASVKVKCDFIPDALQIPVQAVHPHGKDFYALVREGGDWKAQKLKVGPTNSEFFVVEEGLREGDRVAMNPRPYLAAVELPELPPAPKRDRELPSGEGPQQAMAERPADATTNSTPTSTTTTTGEEAEDRSAT